MGTRADFYVGMPPNAEWIGSTSYDGHPDIGWGKRPLAARTEQEFRSAVETMLSDKDALVTRPSEGWPWPWEDSRTTDYAYAFDPARGTVIVSHFGHVWVTAEEFHADNTCLYAGRRLASGEVTCMAGRPRADLLAKSGILYAGGGSK